MRTVFCRILFRIFGHRICCGTIPEWIGGPKWEPIDVKPRNPWNVLWRIQTWIRERL